MEAPLNHKLETMPPTPAYNIVLDTSSECGSQSPIYLRDDKDAWNSFEDHHEDQRSINMGNNQEVSNWEDDIIDDFGTDNTLTQHLPEGPNNNDNDDEVSNYDSQSTR